MGDCELRTSCWKQNKIQSIENLPFPDSCVHGTYEKKGYFITFQLTEAPTKIHGTQKRKLPIRIATPHNWRQFEDLYIYIYTSVIEVRSFPWEGTFKKT